MSVKEARDLAARDARVGQQRIKEIKTEYRERTKLEEKRSLVEETAAALMAGSKNAYGLATPTAATNAALTLLDPKKWKGQIPEDVIMSARVILIDQLDRIKGQMPPDMRKRYEEAAKAWDK